MPSQQNIEVPAKDFSGEVRVWGEFRIINGDRVTPWYKNKIVGQGLRHLVESLHSASNIAVEAFNTTGYTMRVGTGTGATADTTTALVTPNTTAPNTVALAVRESPSAANYRLKLSCTWNAGALPAVSVTEIEIRAGGLLVTLGSSTTTQNAMFSRLSSTDAEFTAFTINTAVPLTIEYRLNFNFA